MAALSLNTFRSCPAKPPPRNRNDPGLRGVEMQTPGQVPRDDRFLFARGSIPSAHIPATKSSRPCCSFHAVRTGLPVHWLEVMGDRRDFRIFWAFLVIRSAQPVRTIF